ncbi:hypothetical protein [Streptomyces rimosus]
MDRRRERTGGTARLRRFPFDRHTHEQPATGIARKDRARPAARW